MNVGRAFNFAFEDENWAAKVLVGGVLVFLSFLIIPPVFVGGYMIEVLRNTALGITEKLPEWDDWGAKFTRGLLSFLIDVVYYLPVILLDLCLVLILAALGPEQGSDREVVSAVLSICLGLPTALYALIASLVLPAAQLRYAVTDDVMAAFRLREVFSLISENLGNYALAILVVIAVSIAAVLIAGITLFLCGLGLLLAPFVLFWSCTVMAHILGQVYRLRPIAVKPEESAALEAGEESPLLAE